MVSKIIERIVKSRPQIILLSIAYSTLSSLHIENSTQLKLFFFHFMITSSMPLVVNMSVYLTSQLPSIPLIILSSWITYLNGLDSMVQCLSELNPICQIVRFGLNAQINSMNPIIAPMKFHKALYSDHYFSHCRPTPLLLVHCFLPSLSITREG